MKLAKIQGHQSKFRVPYKLYEDDQQVADGFKVIAEDVYKAVFQFVIFENGVFDYNPTQREGIIATLENTPWIFATEGPFIVQQIPFETRVDIDKGQVSIGGVFALEQKNLGNYEEMRRNFEDRVKKDLLQQIDKQIADLQQARKIIQ